jgi:hypothetical protein
VSATVHHTVGVMVWGAISHGSRSRSLFIRGTAQPPARQRTPTYCSIFFGCLGRGINRIVAMASIPRFVAHQKSVGCDGEIHRRFTTSSNNFGRTSGCRSEACDFTDNAIASMPRRMQDCIRERGSPTHY